MRSLVRKSKAEKNVLRKHNGRKKRGRASGGKKKRGRAGPKVKYTGKKAKKLKRFLKKESPKSKRARGEDSMDSQVFPAATSSRPRRVNSVQKDAFLDRRLNTVAFFAFFTRK